MPPKPRRCELCSHPAALFCPSDSAYLCRRCDASVHAANFLVSRHLRSSLCPSCGDLSTDQFAGPALTPHARDLCGSCGGRHQESSISSICLSTTESGKETSGEVSSPLRRRRRERERERTDDATEAVLVNWCRRVGLDGNLADLVVSTAATAYQRMPRVHMRVAVATSFWVGLRYLRKNGVATCYNLARVEKITGVPAKEILVVEGKMGRVLKSRGIVAPTQSSLQEGWAEC